MFTNPSPTSATANSCLLQRHSAVCILENDLDLQILPRHSLRNSAPVGAEAQLRWSLRRRRQEDRQGAPQGVSLPANASAGAISVAGGWALRAACHEATQWRSGLVSVSVAKCQIEHRLLHEQVAAALLSSGLDAERLELSLAEPAMDALDDDGHLTMAALRDFGVGLAMDEFGAGACSLSLLRRLPITGLRLSRALVRGVTVEPEDDAMVRTLVAMAHALGLSVVADGIETEPQLRFLASCGCDEGQGSYFTPPLALPGCVSHIEERESRRRNRV